MLVKFLNRTQAKSLDFVSLLSNLHILFSKCNSKSLEFRLTKGCYSIHVRLGLETVLIVLLLIQRITWLMLILHELLVEAIKCGLSSWKISFVSVHTLTVLPLQRHEML